MPPASNAPKVLRVGIIQSGKIVEERVIRIRQSVTVGPSEKCTFVIPQQDVATHRFELFETAGGPYSLNFLSEMKGRLSINGKVSELSDLAGSGTAVRKGKGDHFSLVLDDQSRGKVILGETTVLFQFVDPPPIQPRPQLPAAVRGSVFSGVELVISICFALSLLFHGTLIGYMMYHDWPELTMEEKMLRLEELLNRGQATFEKSKAKTDGEGDSADKDKEKEDKAEKEKVAEKKKEAEQDAGPQKSAEEVARERAERRAELAEQIAQRGINKILGTLGGEGEGAISDVLRGGDVGADQDDLLSQVNGVGVATGEGDGALKGPAGGKGSGEAADISQLKVEGGDTTVNTAGPGPEKKISGDVKKKNPIASGGTGMMSSSDVADVVNRKIGAIKGCYEQGLKRDPALKGKVTIRFTISGTGKVTTARATLNELSSQVGDCIANAFTRFRFPPPEGGEVTFEYPFLFTPAN